MSYAAFTKKYRQDHPGATLVAINDAWNRSGKRGPGRPPKSAREIVPTADGADVTMRGGAGHLSASVEGHVEVQFDQGALGAIWAGLIEGLRQDSGVNLAALFPELYPDAAAAMRRDRIYRDNYAIGRAMARLYGAALVAYRVTPEENAGWYVRGTAQRFMIPASQIGGTCVQVSAAMVPGGDMRQLASMGLPAEAMNQAAQFGGVLGAPAGAVVPAGQFGAGR